MSRHKVIVNHCIDVEGPMTETVEATWERLKEEDGIEVTAPPTKENLKKLQLKQLPVSDDEQTLSFLARKYSADNLNYFENWDEIDSEFRKIISPEFRRKNCDSKGGAYRFNWFIYDHYGFKNNPRFHAEGIHAIFDHYHELFLEENEFNDGVYWHYHHVPSSGDALEWNTNWWMNGIHEEILARRIIERNWFPSVFRAGGHIERNDLSYWLEMFIPFDFSARTSRDLNRLHGAAAVNDWRFSPYRWGYYHPDFYDYRKPGNMKRSLYRCLDLRTWITAITEEDVREAFEQAKYGYDTVLAYYNHDFRPMSDDIENIVQLIRKVHKEFPEVDWEFDNCLNSARSIQGYTPSDKAPDLQYSLDGTLLSVTSDSELFGPEPFLAIKESGRFFRDNFTRESNTKWCYRFRKPSQIESFGIAANSQGGLTSVLVHNGPVL